MKFFVTGVNGQLGFDVVSSLVQRGHTVTGNGSKPLSPDSAFASVCHSSSVDYICADITDKDAVRDAVFSVMPDAVIHCAAYTAVDAAEKEANREKVYAVNSIGTANLAGACAEVGAKMLYISTDYVFGGGGTDPWDPDCVDFSPLNVYGDSKLRGEDAVREALEKFFIIRTSWVFGANGSNFVKTMLRLSETYDSLRVVNDQIGSPTYTVDLARLIADMIETEKYGHYHARNEGGFISWYDFACEIFRLAGRNTRVIPVSTEEYGLSSAARPENSRLSTDKLAASGFDCLPGWNDALQRFLAAEHII